MPKTPVTVTNIDTQITRHAETAESGVYAVPNLNAGRYFVTVAVPGFTPYQSETINLSANQIRPVDAHLTAGQQQAEVNVSSNVAGVNAESGTLSNVTPTAQLAQLPVITRQKGDQGLWGYENYDVGVSHPPFFTANGSRYIDTQPTVDGITAMSYETGVGGSTVQPGIEATGEVSVQLADAPAEFSRSVQMTMVTKSGTNEPHGSIFEDYNGNSLNARDFFSQKTPFRVYNNFGGSVGGPILKNRTFYFGDYEGSRESTELIDTLNVPPSEWRAGNFGSVSKALINPFNGQQFPNNQIPASLISPVSQKLQSLFFPAPNYGPPGLQAGNYRALLRPGNNGVTIYDKFDTRLDHNFSERDSLFGRFSYAHMPIHAYIADAVPPFGFRESLRVATSGVLTWNHIFTPTLINEGRFGFTRDNNQIQSPIIGSDVLRQVGIQGISTTGIPVYPILSVSGLTSAGQVPSFIGIGTNFEGIDNLTWIKGSHTMKFGLDIIRDRDTSSDYGGDVYGRYNFLGTFTGNAYADFLLGLPQSTSYSIPSPIPHQFGWWTGLYAQDQYKVTPRFTLNYGLRWELQTPYSDNRGLLYNFDPNTGALIVPDQGMAKINPQFPRSIPIETATQAHVPQSLLETHHAGYWYPRLGFAYRPLNRNSLVIRGGYGLYALTTYGSAGLFLIGGPFSGSQTFANSISAGTPALSFPNPFTAQWQTPAESVNGINPQLGVGYMQQWNFTVEQGFRGFVFGASYVGTHTINIPYQRNLNQPPPSTQPFSTNELRYPAYFSVDYVENGATERYNALQLYAKRQFEKNLFMNLGFTWAKDLTDSQDQQSFAGAEIENAYNRAADRGPSSYVRPLRFFANAVYQIPVGQNQRYFSSLSKPLDLILGDWRMGWNVVAESGLYYTPYFDGPDTSNTNALNTNNVQLRPDRTGPTSFAIPGCPANDPICSNPQNVGRFGNSGVNVLQGPHLIDFDLSLMKDFHITERFNLEFRGTATNVFNHPNFSNPAADISSPGTFGISTSTAYELYGQQSRFVDFMLRLRF